VEKNLTMVDLFRVMKELVENTKDKEIKIDKKIFWRKKQKDFQMECSNVRIQNVEKNIMEAMVLEDFVQNHVEDHIQLSKTIL